MIIQFIRQKPRAAMVMVGATVVKKAGVNEKKRTVIDTARLSCLQLVILYYTPCSIIVTF